MTPRTGSAQPKSDGFLRVLGRGDVLALAFGAMIGFGWVVLTSDFIRAAGPGGAALAFAVGGVVVALVGLCYAELVSAMPHAGGEHVYGLRALGGHGAFVASWAIVLGYLSVAAFEAVALPQTLLHLFPDMLAGELWTVAGYQVHATWVAVGSGSAVVVTLLNYLGIRPASLFQTLAVLFLLGVGALLVLGALTGGEREHLTPLFRGGAGGVLTVLVAVPFLFVGFDVVPQSAAEINLPRRLVGRLLVLSVVCAALWYVLVMLTVGAGLGPDALASADLASAEGMAALWHSPLMGDVLVLGGIAGILTSWNAFLIGASRLLYAMAASRMLPTWFARLHPRFRTPSNAVLFVGGLSALAPLFGESMLEWLVNAGGINIVVAYVVVVLSFLRLRHREPAMERPFRAPAGQLVGTLALLLSLALGTLYLPGMPAALTWPAEWLIAGAWWALGALLLLRLPWTGAGADAEGRLVAAVERRRGR